MVFKNLCIPVCTFDESSLSIVRVKPEVEMGGHEECLVLFIPRPGYPALGG